MKLRQKLLITFVAMLIASFVGVRHWLMAFDRVISSYLAGMIGGLTAIPVWEQLCSLSPKKTP